MTARTKTLILNSRCSLVWCDWRKVPPLSLSTCLVPYGGVSRRSFPFSNLPTISSTTEDTHTVRSRILYRLTISRWRGYVGLPALFPITEVYQPYTANSFLVTSMLFISSSSCSVLYNAFYIFTTVLIYQLLHQQLLVNQDPPLHMCKSVRPQTPSTQHPGSVK